MSYNYPKALLTGLTVFFCLWLGIADNGFAQTVDEYETNRIIIQFSEDAVPELNRSLSAEEARTSITSVDALHQQLNVVSMTQTIRTDPRYADQHRSYGLDRWYTLEFASDVDVLSVVEMYKSDSYVAHAEPSFIYELMGSPTSDPFSAEELMEMRSSLQSPFDDPRFDEQWHYENTGQTGGTVGSDISLIDAWEIEKGDSEVIVQVVDTGIDLTHPDLENMLWVNPFPGEENGYLDDFHGWNHVQGSSNIQDTNGHGSHCSGTIAAQNNNGVGVAGVAGGDGSPDSGVRIMTSRVFIGATGGGGFAEALVYGADNGAVISNNSWGGGQFSQVLRDAILYFIETAGFDPDGNPNGPVQGGLIIFAAGNSNVSTPNQPIASNPEVMAIAATNHNDQRSWYSQWGDWVHMSAPGGETDFTGDPEGVLSTVTNGNYQFYQGTSMAAPHVAGVAALIASSFKDDGISPDMIFDRLVATTDPIDDLNPNFALGSGRLNAVRALEQDDGIAPAPITDLEAIDQSPSSITLSWTATGSSEDQGVAFSYDIRYSESPITASNFESANQFDANISPSSSGSTEEVAVTGLNHSTEYYFAVKASDFFGNVSDISNTTSGTTEGSPEIVLDPTELFGQADVGGEPVSAVLTVKNEGNAEMHFSIPGVSVIDLLSRPGVQPNETSEIYGNSMMPERGEPDEREGHEVLLGAGGPDEFGYTWVDSNEDNGVEFDWIDISDSGTELSALTGTWDGNTSVNLPFDFPFYGDSHSSARVSVNGWVHFGNFSGNAYNNREIPNTSDPTNFLAVLWDDLDMRTTGRIYTYHDESANRFIIQWDGVPKSFSSGSTFTFQAILDSGGSITYQYQSLSGNTSDNTVGIENQNGTDGLQVAFNTTYLQNNLAVRFSTAPDWISFDQASGTVQAGESMDITAFFDPSGLEAGFYYHELSVSSNTVGNPSVDLPLAFQVGDGTGDLLISSSNFEFDNLFVNGTDTRSLTLQNIGGGPLEILQIESDSESFSVSESAFTIIPGSEHTIDVIFNPQSEGNLSGTLVILTDMDDADPVEISVSGTGILAPEASFTLAEDVINVVAGDVSETEFAVFNSSFQHLQFEISVGDVQTIEQLSAGEDRSSTGISLLSAYASGDENLYGFADAAAWGEFTETDAELATLSAAAFDRGSSSVIYALDENGSLTRMNLLSGNTRTVHKLNAISGTATDIAVHPDNGRPYVLANDETSSYLYKVDEETITLKKTTDVVFSHLALLSSGTAVLATESGELYSFNGYGQDDDARFAYSGTLAVNGALAGLGYDYSNGTLFAASVHESGTTLHRVHPLTAASEEMSTSAQKIDWFAVQGESNVLSDWISVEPSSGSVGSTTSVEGILTVDTDGISPGTYEVMLTVFTDDPLNEEITVTVEINVLGDDEAYVQLIHNAADPELATIDVYVNGELMLESFGFREATEFLTVEADRELDIDILPAGSENMNDSMYDISFEIETGKRYTLVAVGLLNPADFAGNPSETGFDIQLLESPMRSSDDEESIAGFFYHGLTDVEELDVHNGLGDVLAEGLILDGFSDYFYLSDDVHSFDLFISGAAEAFASFETDLTGHAGEAVTFLSSGFRYPSNNMGGSEVSVMAVFSNGDVLMPQQATSSGDDIADLPDEFSLDQNYPNPFNPTTQISYSLPESGDVTLEIYNVQGQRVATLVNGQQSAGTHTVTFDAGRLSSGVYLYRIQSGSYTEVRKMMLVK